MRKLSSVLTGFVLLSIVLVNPAVSASFPSVKGLNDPDVIGCVQIKGPLTIIDKAAALAASMGLPVSPADLRSELGKPFGDPAFQNLDGTAVATIVLFNPDKFPEPSLFVKAKEPEKIAEFVRKGGLAAYTEGRYVIFSKTQQNLAKSGGLLPAVESLAKEEITGDISVSLELSRIMSIYKDRIDQGIAQILMMMKMASAAAAQPAWTSKILELEIMGYVDLAGQVERLGLSVGLEKDAVRLSKTVLAVEGSPMANVLTSGDGVGPEWDHFIPADSFLSYSMSTDPQKLMDFMKEEVRRITENRPADRDALLKMFDIANFWAGIEKAEGSFGMVTTPESPMGIVGVMQTPGKKVPLDALKKAQDAIQAFQDLTGEKEAPFKILVEENAREYKGVSITKVMFRVNPSAFPPDVFEQMKKIYDMIRYQVAITGDYFVMAGSDDQMNQSLDQVSPKTPPQPERTLKARTYFPEGGCLYADVDLAGYIKFLLQFVSNTGMPIPLTPQLLEGVRHDPICAYVASGDKEFHGELRVPTGPIIDLVNSLKTAFAPPPSR